MPVVNYLKKVQLPNNVEYTVKDPTFFTGTTEEWNLLSIEEKQSYKIVNLTDDEEDFEIIHADVDVNEHTLELDGDSLIGLEGKVDKVQSATAGNFASLDTNGNITDSGVAASSIENLGTASTYDVPESGDASDNEVVKGDDTRLGNIKGNNTVLTTDKNPFLIRQTLNPTGFSGYVREKLVGASYAWNQLCENGDFASTDNWSPYNSSFTSLSISNNIATLTFTNVDGATYKNAIYQQFSDADKAKIGHKYLIRFDVKLSYNGSFGLDNYGGGVAKEFTANVWNSLYTIWNATSEYNTILLRARSTPAINDTVQIKNVIVSDLTLAFGSTIADYLYGLSNNGGITKLRDMGCPIDKYTAYGYNLVSSKTSGKKIVGKNLVERLIKGYNIASNGSIGADADYDLCIAKVIEGKQYAITSNSGTYVYAFFTESPQTTSASYNNSRAVTSANSFTSPINGWVAFRKTTAMDTPQLELGSTSTTYEPYCGYEISLGNDELRGKFDLVNGEIVASGDVKESNGEITRVRKRVNLGDYTWIYSVDNVIFYTSALDAKNSPNNCICAKYTDYGQITAFSQLSDREVSVSSGLSTSVLIVIKDTAYNDATTFKTAMNGVYLEYELATPTTEQSTPFADPMSMVGATTEEYIDTRDIPCPVGAERQYMGESDDIIPIPSSPMSDGKRVLTSYKSGDKEQLVWEGMIKKKVYTVTTNASGQAEFYEIIDGVIVGVESSYYYTLRNSSTVSTYKYIKLYNNDTGEPLANTTVTIALYVMDF